jgi:TonB family protein
VAPEPEFDALLTEIAQQALLTTRATGAAIALAQGEEMVCRATTGGHAPDLGVRLDTTSGLSGACVQTSHVQICGDTEMDPRVDVETCRALGVRSILVAPLLQKGALIGVMELFSPIVRSFGERDIQTIEACARRILEAMEKRPGSDEVAANENPEWTDSKSPAEPPPFAFSDSVNSSEPIRKRDFGTTVLTGMVIGLAILFGSLLGMRIARQRGSRSLAYVVPTLPPAKAAVSVSPAVEPSDAATSNEPPHTSKSETVNPTKTIATGNHAGGLVIYQNNRVVFQIPPSQAEPGDQRDVLEPNTEAGSFSKLTPAAAGELLISRVEPQYPPEALAAHIQGTVGIHLQVDRAGSVQRARVFSGPPELAQAAVDAVRQWRFRPYSPNGKAQDFQTTATIDFRLP